MMQYLPSILPRVTNSRTSAGVTQPSTLVLATSVHHVTKHSDGTKAKNKHDKGRSIADILFIIKSL